jgi:hypothetical protein
MVEAPNVTPIREAQAAAPMALSSHGASSGALDDLDFEIPQQFQQAANGGPSASDLASSGTGFESPFEDEFETPAFLRKGRLGSFMRRGGD